MIQVLAVVGPTATGKTALALELGERLQTEIISADSQQFYRGMEIGTAAPTSEERSRIPHHFVSFLDPGESMTAGDYERLARPVVERLNRQGKSAVLVGGSGLYIQALIEGLFEGPPRNQAIRNRLRAEARAQGNEHLFHRLEFIDPEYARLLTSANDLVRIVRALEVYEITGRPISALHREFRESKPALCAVKVAIDMPRDILYDRIDRRVAAMLDAGWLEETQTLLDAGHYADIQRLKSHGYRELAAYLRGETSLEAAIETTKRNVRHYAKRQFTWFRADKSVLWLPAGPETAASALADRVFEQHAV